MNVVTVSASSPLWTSTCPTGAPAATNSTPPHSLTKRGSQLFGGSRFTLACDLTWRGCLRWSGCLGPVAWVRLRGHADANFPPGAAWRLPRPAARLLPTPRRRPHGPWRRTAVRRDVPVAAAPEPGAGPPAWLGQHLRRAGQRPRPGRAAARPAGRLPAGRRPAGVRGRCHDLAALRRRVLP